MQKLSMIVLLIAAGYTQRAALAQDAKAPVPSTDITLDAKKTAVTNMQVYLPPPVAPDKLVADSPFGINNAFRPGTGDLETRLKAMQQIGIKWGRQDFNWKAIEKSDGVYDWSGYDKLVDQCHQYGLSIFGNFAYGPDFHDPRTPAGVEAYCRFAAAAVKRYAGKVDYWQIWNEPNGGFWKGTPEQYAAMLAASGKAIHEANPNAKVLGLNSAFIDPVWTEKVLSLVPYDCFDIACAHPYRVMASPEDKMDWWQKDQYVGNFYKGKLDETWPMIHETFLEQIGELDKVMSKYGKPKPIWITEICWNTNIHPYGTNELRQADMIVRFYLLGVASQRVQKMFWWTLRDGGQARQFDMGDMVGLMRADMTPKYSYYAYSFMTRMVEGKKWVRNDLFGPDVYALVFSDEASGKETIVAWANKSYAYIKVNNTEAGLTFYDVFGTKRFVQLDQQRTSNLTVPLDQSPIYIVAPKGVTATLRPDPGW